MITKIEKAFRSPYSVPNGLQVTDEGLWVVDQITDRVALVEITSDPDYTVPKLIRDIPSESSNTSGMTYRRRRALVSRKRFRRTVESRPRHRCPDRRDFQSRSSYRRDPRTLSRYPMVVARTVSNTTTTTKDISGSKPSRIRLHIRSGFRIGLYKRRFRYLMDVDTAWFALKMGFGQPIPLIGLLSNLILRMGRRLM